MKRFGPTDFEDFDEALSKIKQTGSFRDYLREFERLSTRVEKWPSKALLGAFMGGLSDDLASDVRMFRPKKLTEAIELAKRMEEKLQRAKRGSTGKLNTRTTTMITPKAEAIAARPSPPTAMKLLTYEEMRARREKNLCFNCDEKFTPGHRCKLAQAFMVVVDDDHTNEEVDEGGQCDIGVDSSDPQISLHALAGGSGPRTMRLQAQITQHTVNVLVDTGSTHNFIHPNVAGQLKLAVTPIPPFIVRVASGDRLECKEMYKRVPLNIRGFKFFTTLYALPITSMDVVLGVQWLKSLGKIVFYYSSMTMEFMVGGNQFQFCATPIQASKTVGIHSIIQEWKCGAELFVLAATTESTTMFRPLEENIPTDIQHILGDFKQVLDEPSSLPPQQPFDHRIRLQDESRSVNVAPYRYAHFQKNEIER